MTRSRIPNRPGLYALAERFVQEGLARDGSLFAPGQSIWRADVIQEFYTRFAIESDEGKRNFQEKLGDQLAGASRDLAQFTGELFFVYSTISVITKPESKEQLVNFALSQAEGTTGIPRELRPALKTGMAAPGPGLNQHRFWMVRFFVEFLIAWKNTLTDGQRAELLRDPWAFRDFLFGLKLQKAQTVRAALLHFVHPETFEPIVSERHKNQIVRAFAEYAPQGVDADRALYEVREKLTPRYGESYNYYVQPVRGDWDDEPWRTFIEWAGHFRNWSGFDAAERDYKIELARKLARAREALLKGDEWRPLMTAALKAVTASNLVPWQSVGSVQKWIDEDPGASDALRSLWTDDPPLKDRIDSFADSAGKAIARSRERTTAALLMGIDPLRYPPFASRALNKGYRLTGFMPPKDGATAGEKYEHALTFFEKIVTEAAKYDLVLRDVLDAQSLLWAMVKYPVDQPPISGWTAEEKTDFLKFRGDIAGGEDDDDWRDSGPGPGPKPDPGQSQSIDGLANEILIDSAFLKQTMKLLTAKKQIICYGPPGTGKTFVARKLAWHIAGDPKRVKLVQFHASYTYEDFVEGYRPARAGNGFTLVDGPLKEMAAMARKAPDEKYVLIIDELNRGNAAKVFGELYFLLEYRDEGIRLQYSQEAFSLPPNLLIIGTMNTADRSIALIDAALRRRFFFVPFFPDKYPVAGLLKRWLQRENSSLIWIADVVDLTNKRMGDPHFAIGPSHFMQPDLDEGWIQLIWKHSIEPYLEERYFGGPENLAQFDLAKLRNEVIVRHEDDADTPHS